MKEVGLRRALIVYLFLGLFGQISIAQEGGEQRPGRIVIHAAKLLEVKAGKTVAESGHRYRRRQDCQRWSDGAGATLNKRPPHRSS